MSILTRHVSCTNNRIYFFSHANRRREVAGPKTFVCLLFLIIVSKRGCFFFCIYVFYWRYDSLDMNNPNLTCPDQWRCWWMNMDFWIMFDVYPCIQKHHKEYLQRYVFHDLYLDFESRCWGNKSMLYQSHSGLWNFWCFSLGQ